MGEKVQEGVIKKRCAASFLTVVPRQRADMLL